MLKEDGYVCVPDERAGSIEVSDDDGVYCLRQQLGCRVMFWQRRQQTGSRRQVVIGLRHIQLPAIPERYITVSL